MQHLTAEQYINDANLITELDSCAELIDGRFAVVNQVMYEVLDRKGCSNGKNYGVLLVRSAGDVYGPESLACEPNLDLNIIEVYIADLDEEPHAIHAKMIELMTERLRAY